MFITQTAFLHDAHNAQPTDLSCCMEDGMTKVYCTLGPACASLACLEAMVLQGLEGIRLNLSHATLQEEQDNIETVRAAFDHCGKPARLLLDLQGPELRVGHFETPLEIREGTYVELDTVRLPDPVSEVLQPGHEILLDDGKIMLSVEDTSLAFARRGGILTSRKSVSVPGVSIDAPCLTDVDKANIAVAVDYGVTSILQPFVRSRDDLETVRKALDDAGGQDIELMAKVESMEGINNLSEFLPAADSIVIARGDLGNAMPLWDLPAAQKRIAAICRRAGKPFMVATQMLSSMEKSSVPTRAEVSDVFNAVLDGADSVMATGETAIGAHPIEVVRFLVNTVRAAQTYLDQT